jgi:hypothetical protein
MVLRTFPTALIYNPTSLGECGEELLSDSSQLQKWTYLQVLSHLGHSSSDVVTDLITRAQQGNILSPSRYCSSLIEWGHKLGISLSRAQPTALPQGVTDFLQAVTSKGPITIYTELSFELIRKPLLAALSLSRTNQTAQYGRGATGIYIPLSAGHPALALQLTTQTGRATDAYYQELLGTAMGALMVQHHAIHAYSGCHPSLSTPWDHRLVGSKMVPSLTALGS